MFKTALFSELNAVKSNLTDYLYFCKIGKAKLSKVAKDQLNKYFGFNSSLHTAIKTDGRTLIVSTDTKRIVLNNISYYKRMMYSPTKFITQVTYEEDDDTVFLDECLYMYIADYYDKAGVKHTAELELYDNMLSIIVGADCLAIIPIREEDLM